LIQERTSTGMGGAWSASDNSFAQATTEGDFNTNVAALPVGDTFDFRVHFDDNQAAQMSADNLILTYSSLLFDLTNPVITPVAGLDASAQEGGVTTWDSFTFTEVKAGLDEIKYILSDDDGTTFRFWGGSSWDISDLTYAQSSTGAVVNTNIGSFPTSNSKLLIRAFLHTDDGSTTPSLDEFTINYTTLGTFDISNPTIVPKTTFRTDLLESFAETATKPGGTEIKYILSKDALDHRKTSSL